MRYLNCEDCAYSLLCYGLADDIRFGRCVGCEGRFLIVEGAGGSKLNYDNSNFFPLHKGIDISKCTYRMGVLRSILCQRCAKRHL